jgi:subtilisin family serine protease
VSRRPASPPARSSWHLPLLALALATAGAAQADDEVPREQVAGELLVRLTTPAALPPLLLRHGLVLAGGFGQRPIYRLSIVGSASVGSKVAALELEPTVLAAEPNLVHRSPEARKNVVWAIGSAQAYAAQWAPAALRLAEAQAVSTGAGVRVAVLDTGVDAGHPALQGRLLPGADFVDGDLDPSERAPGIAFGHGTHVAGLVALAAPGSAILPLRVLDADGQGNAWVLAEAMLHAVDPDGNPATADGAHVINLSLGTPARSRIVEAVTKLASCAPGDAAAPALIDTPGYEADQARCTVAGGAVVVAAAGNDGSRDLREYPAAEGEYGLLAVAASAADRRLAPFSNRGRWIDLAAPGDRITSSVPGGLWGTWSGTSMAAPLAAGTAALLRAASPGLSAREVVQRLVDTAAPLCNTRLRQLDAGRALTGVAPARQVCP